MKHINKNPNINKGTAVFTLALIAFIWMSRRELLAQQTSDLPATPGVATGGENASAPVACFDDASVNSARTLTFGERLKIYGRSFTNPENIMGPILGAGEGYSTMIGERGATFSGGQRRRIAIARAIIRDTPILILDEPTPGLDSASERTVVEGKIRWEGSVGNN